MPVHVAKGAIIAISVIAATAYAVYESPEVRQFLLNLRRQAAHTLHNLGDNIQPSERREEEQGQPLFNRPEDAEGVLERGGVDADEASRRRQREELAYWNSLREAKKTEKDQEQTKTEEQRPRGLTRTSSFGDFLARDADAEQGTYVLRSGAEPAPSENLVHRRAASGRGIDRGAMFANPFGDEHGIELDLRENGWGAQQQQLDMSQSLMTPGRDEVLSVASEVDSEGLYCASDNRIRRPIGSSNMFVAPVPFAPVELPNRPIETAATPSPFSTLELSAKEEKLIDTSDPEEVAPPAMQTLAVEEEEEETQYATSASHPREAGESDAYAAIHAWADGANSLAGAGFYSPLPATPQVLSEASEGGFGSDNGSSNDGAATPRTVDSASLIGGESGGEEGGEGRSTPGSWTEVGSVVSSLEGRGA